MVGRDYLWVSFVIHIKVRYDLLDLVLTKVVSIFLKSYGFSTYDIRVVASQWVNRVFDLSIMRGISFGYLDGYRYGICKWGLISNLDIGSWIMSVKFRKNLFLVVIFKKHDYQTN